MYCSLIHTQLVWAHKLTNSQLAFATWYMGTNALNTNMFFSFKIRIKQFIKSWKWKIKWNEKGSLHKKKGFWQPLSYLFDKTSLITCINILIVFRERSIKMEIQNVNFFQIYLDPLSSFPPPPPPQIFFFYNLEPFSSSLKRLDILNKVNKFRRKKKPSP